MTAVGQVFLFYRWPTARKTWWRPAMSSFRQGLLGLAADTEWMMGVKILSDEKRDDRDYR